MKITGIHAWPVKMRLAEPYTIAYEKVDAAENIFFRIETNQGIIETPVLVNASGAWAPQIGEMVGVDIPIQPVRRQIVVTTPVPEVSADTA